MNLHRLSQSYVDALVAIGFLGQRNRIGLSYTDCPDIVTAVRESFEPALKRHGLKLAEKFGVRCVQSQGETGAAVAENASSVLRFRDAGVDRVLFLSEYAGLQELLFMRQAEQQNYRPRYGLTTRSGPHGALAARGSPDSPPNVSPSQLEGSVGIGYLPLIDAVPETREPLPASARRCLKIYEDNGFGPAGSDNEIGARLNYCESFFLFEEIVTAASQAIGRDSVVRAVEALGTRHVATGTYAADFGPGRHDGVYQYRNFRYHMNCECYRYEGPRHAFPR